MLADLKDRLMAPEIAEDAMRAYADETERAEPGASLQRRRLAHGTGKGGEAQGIIEAIKHGMFHPRA